MTTMAAKGRSPAKRVPPKPKPSPFKNQELVDTLVSGNTTFAVNLFRKLIEASPCDNIFFSPLSISTALAMTALGTKENTVKEMIEVLSLADLAKSDVHPTFADMNAALKSEGGESGYKLHLANRLFCRKNYVFLEEFLAATSNHYNAESALLDFVGDPSGSRQTINQWVEDQTANKIKDVIPAGCIDDLTTLILVNAIYFKGDWKHKFEEKNTKKEKFIVNDEESFDVDMMHLYEDLDFAVNRELDCRIVELPYGNRDLSMFILLPEKPNQLNVLEEKLTPEVLQASLKKMSNVNVNLSMPKFKLEDQFSLNNMLSTLGMKDVFIKGKADLSGMDGSKELYVSNVLHKSFIEVNEKGTEAAAATAIQISCCCMPVTMDFKANRPFLFLIRDNRSKSILFLGRMLRPPTA